MSNITDVPSNPQYIQLWKICNNIVEEFILHILIYGVDPDSVTRDLDFFRQQNNSLKTESFFLSDYITHSTNLLFKNFSDEEYVKAIRDYKHITDDPYAPDDRLEELSDIMDNSIWKALPLSVFIGTNLEDLEFTNDFFYSRLVDALNVLEQ